MSYLGDYIKGPLVDPMSNSFYSISQSKIEDNGTYWGLVTAYDPKTHMADILLDTRAGYGRAVRMRIQEQYTGPIPGTGEANAYWGPNKTSPTGQRVQVVFMGGSATGLVNQGMIVGSNFTHNSHYAPAYAPFQTVGTGTVRVYPTKDGNWGNAEHTDAESNVSKTTVAKTNHEDWGNHHQVVNGPNITRSEELTRRASEGHLAAAKRLGG
jgi:hypothetical protein